MKTPAASFSCDWAALVVAARRGDAGPLLDALRPTLAALSHHVGGVYHEDALQEAEIRVWQRAADCDPGRPSSVRTFLVSAGVRAMRDCVRRHLCRRAAPIHLYEPVVRPIERFEDDLPPTLAVYLEQVREIGDTEGMHRAVADRLGLTIATVSTRFHREARRYKEACL